MEINYYIVIVLKTQSKRGQLADSCRRKITEDLDLGAIVNLNK